MSRIAENLLTGMHKKELCLRGRRDTTTSKLDHGHVIPSKGMQSLYAMASSGRRGKDFPVQNMFVEET
jgi:hypothetical protein